MALAPRVGFIIVSYDTITELSRVCFRLMAAPRCFAKKKPRAGANRRGDARRSVFRRQHDRQNPDGLLRIGKVFAALGHHGVVIVDLPENAVAVMLEGSEVALAVRIGRSVR